MSRKATFALGLALLLSASAAAQTVPPAQSEVNIIDREAVRITPREAAQGRASAGQGARLKTDLWLLPNLGKTSIDGTLPLRPLLLLDRSRVESGNVGGIAQASKLNIEGNISVGRGYGGIAAPPDGMIIQGNVGIGTPSPTAKLHVGGTPGVDGIRFPDGTLMTSAGVGSSSNLANAVDALVNADADGNGSGAVRLQTNATDRLIITNGGNVGIGVPNPSAKLEIAGTAKTNGLDVAGTTQTAVLQITGGADLSEQFEVKAASDADHNSSQQLQPGWLVSIDPRNPGKLVVSSQAYDRKVAGIISGAGGVKTGVLMGQASSVADGDYPVALSGRVYCWADTANGSIEPGDLLTASNTPGHAMKVTNHKKAQGAVIGKAMSGLKQGRGLVLVLVTLQ
jgi:hypothetical protein